MIAQDLIAFRDAVAKDVASQYKGVDYLNPVVANAIERHIELIGWKWFIDGPRTTEKQE